MPCTGESSPKREEGREKVNEAGNGVVKLGLG